ncbi:rod shape-determining protein MreC [Wolinella succinogenes]|uniref:rod shape-determining protein MreC n=1 Tax=Wolinella succinogenes TaxID=844 RepID=UPI000F6DD93D|nr:rod shape-determining protein MreC [Wolinella succinogenes]VEG81437.1 rod shape-determining protein MreC [Wolinella succinogenes]
MIKKPLLWLLFLAGVFIGSLKLSGEIHPRLLYLSDAIKVGFLNASEGVIRHARRHFDQVEEIKLLTKELHDKEKLQMTVMALDSELKRLLRFLASNLEVRYPDFKLVRTLSYAEIGDYHKVWLEHDLSLFPPEKIFGLIQNGFAAGIVTNHKGRAMGLLNGDERCSYSVYVGELKAPGIIKALGEGRIVADFIPSWLDVKEGDEVVTSGLDGIFFENIKVGRVTSIRQSQGYLVAEIRPYADSLHPRYFWLIDTPPSLNPDFIENLLSFSDFSPFRGKGSLDENPPTRR